MKLNGLINVWIGHLSLVVVVGGALAVCSFPVNAQVRGGELLQNSKKPDREAQDAGASRRQEESEEARREAAKLRAEAGRAEAEFARGNQERKEQLTKLQRELDEFRGKLKELRGEGKADEAAEVEQHIRNLQRELERRREEFQEAGPERGPRRPPMDRRERFEQRGRMEQRPPGDDRQSPGEMPEAQRRLHHLQAAIDNLHAAGLHEPAEHLAREAEKMRQQLHALPTPPRGPVPRPEPGMRRVRRAPQGELEPLREEIRKLQEAIQDLRHRVEELSRERR